MRATTLLVLHRIARQGGRCNMTQVCEFYQFITGVSMTSGTYVKNLCRDGYLERVGLGKYVITEKARAAVEQMRREVNP